MRVMRADIRTSFRFERRLLDADLEAEAAQHVVEHVIVQIAQPSGPICSAT